MDCAKLHRLFYCVSEAEGSSTLENEKTRNFNVKGDCLIDDAIGI